MTIEELYQLVLEQDSKAKLEGVTLSAGGTLYLRSLTSLPEGVTLSAGGNLYLESLTSLPEGVTLSAGGYLDLRSLTSLPEGVTLSAGGTLDLRSLTSPDQIYQGDSIYLETIDGAAMQRLSSSHIKNGCEYYKAAYFNGRGDGDRCFVARCGEYTAHGDSLATAIRDVRFKEQQANFNADELVKQIKSRGVVTFNDYRLLTGACESGLRAGIKSLGLPEDTQELPLERVIELCDGQYGGDTIRELLSA
ncbi:hypothetical protein Pan241w_11000 [Gimesia alba]|uniref:Uncharacterized protein n=1 Tax=Gimesia alba TaxID=2527973 RepID=A0A517RAZ3_9PLAN|nr:hypothetical protein [Gimesia alba]QDT41041.1 hypothetical protein Pan241w_11000 [Gimesia alba]